MGGFIGTDMCNPCPRTLLLPISPTAQSHNAGHNASSSIVIALRTSQDEMGLDGKREPLMVHR